MLKKLLSIALMILIINSFTACVYNNSDLSMEPVNENIRYAVNSLPSSFSYSREEINNHIEIYSSLFQGLVEKGESGDIVPVLSESYEILDNGIEYRFTLRENAYWSDGSKIKASHLVSFFKELLSPEGEDYIAQGLKAVYGVLSYHKGEVPFNQVAIMSQGEQLLIFRLNYPSEEFLEVLTRPEYYLRAPIASLSNLKEAYKDILYTGAFVLDGYEEASMLLNRNPYYLQREYISKSNVEVILNSSAENILADFYIDKIDIFKNPPVSELSALKSKDFISSRYNETTYMLYFPNRENALDIYYREALSRVIYAHVLEMDYEELSFTSYAYGESFKKVEEANDAVPAGSNAVRDPAKTAKRVYEEKKLAKQYIKKSSYADKVKLRVLMENTERSKKLAAYLKGALKEVLDIDIVFRYGSILEAEVGSYDIYLGTLITTDKETLLYSFYSGHKDSPFNILSEEYDLLISSLMDAKDTELKNRYIDSAIKYLQHSYVYIPIFFDYDLICHKDYIEGVTFDSKGNIVLKELNKLFPVNEEMPKEPIKDITIPIG